MKIIGSAQGLNRRKRQRDGIAFGECENQLRFERAFNMHVQLGFGHGTSQCVQYFVHSDFSTDVTGTDYRFERQLY